MANISSPFGQNEWLVEEMYRKFRDDPSSVDPTWHEFLTDYNPEPVPGGPVPADGAASAAPAPPAAPPAPAAP
ncbi:2-oxoglutarate dehydrogenase E1 subunit family protein, partial [Mycobacterium sp.]|uniref:2-oxoglutarate dehydrogenase E1 subunit family protein n=1 Tax=Mycobacterium sp. TaxID=1785 RepID=UPI003A868BFB